jgi:hypothetical protein
MWFVPIYMQHVLIGGANVTQLLDQGLRDKALHHICMARHFIMFVWQGTSPCLYDQGLGDKAIHQLLCQTWLCPRLSLLNCFIQDPPSNSLAKPSSAFVCIPLLNIRVL